MTQRSLLRKCILILVLTVFLSAVGVVMLHHHDKKAVSDICQICDFANIHFTTGSIDVLITLDYILLPLLIIFFSSYRYRLDNIFRNKAPPSYTV